MIDSFQKPAMTVLEALAILEATTLESKKRDINTPLDSLELHVRPEMV